MGQNYIGHNCVIEYSGTCPVRMYSRVNMRASGRIHARVVHAYALVCALVQAHKRIRRRRGSHDY